MNEEIYDDTTPESESGGAQGPAVPEPRKLSDVQARLKMFESNVEFKRKLTERRPPVAGPKPAAPITKPKPLSLKATPNKDQTVSDIKSPMSGTAAAAATATATATPSMAALPISANMLTLQKEKMKEVENKRASQLVIPKAFQKDNEIQKSTIKKPAVVLKPTANKRPLEVPKKPFQPLPVEDNQLPKDDNDIVTLPAPPIPKGRNLDKSDETINHNGITYKLNKLPPLAEIGDPPPKPQRPSSVKLPAPIDIGMFVKRRKLPSLPPEPDADHTRLASKAAQAAEAEEESLQPEETYDDVGDLDLDLAPSVGHKSRRAVSIIKPMDSDEELSQEEYDDIGQENQINGLPSPGPSGPTQSPKRTQPVVLPEPQEDYDDLEPANISNTNDGIIEEDIYEEFDDMDAEDADISLKNQQDEQAKKEKELAKENKLKEKLEKKQKEKEEKEKLRKQKEDEKETKRKEDERKKVYTKFKMDGTEVHMKEVQVKNDSKGGKYDLVVKKNETLHIIRMDDKLNLAGKWLAQNEEGKFGYIDAKNVEDLRNPSFRPDNDDDDMYNDTEIVQEDDQCVYNDI